MWSWRSLRRFRSSSPALHRRIKTTKRIPKYSTSRPGSPISTDVVNIRTLRDDVSEATETVEVKMMSEGDVVVDKIELSIMDRTVPELTSAVVDGSNLTLNLSEDLDETSEPSASAFDVTVDAVDRTVTNVSVSGSTATLTIDSRGGGRTNGDDRLHCSRFDAAKC